MSDLIIKAAQYARRCHTGQFRKYSTGVPYITHCARVAGRVMALPEFTESMACAAWLHDTIEDCGINSGDLYNAGFDDDTIGMVVDLTNPSKKYPHLLRNERKYIDRDHLAGCSREVKIIKYIDRIDNLRDMGNLATPRKFIDLYLNESRLLVRDMDIMSADPELDAEYNNAVANLEEILWGDA